MVLLYAAISAIYDDFFARFQRGADGSSIENGYSHLLSVNGGTVKLNHSKRIDGHIYVCRRELEQYGKELPMSLQGVDKILDGEEYVRID